jgi:meiotically up-regulated gene 157 (Mug157) protein
MNYQSAFTRFPKSDGKGVLIDPRIAYSCTTISENHLYQISYPLDSIVKVIDLTNVIYEATKAINQITVSIYTSLLKISKLTKVLRKFSIK